MQGDVMMLFVRGWLNGRVRDMPFGLHLCLWLQVLSDASHPILAVTCSQGARRVPAVAGWFTCEAPAPPTQTSIKTSRMRSEQSRQSSTSNCLCLLRG